MYSLSEESTERIEIDSDEAPTNAQFVETIHKAVITCEVQRGCFNQCIVETIHLIDRNGDFHIDVLPDELKNKVEGCYKKFKHLEPCYRAENVAGCFPKL